MSTLTDAVLRAADRDLPRAAISSAILARLTELAAPPESLAAARRVAEPRSVVVVAGQQPVIFGGPGLVFAKALDAIDTARRIEEEHGVPAVAVFWMADEDHDHAEVDHIRMDLENGIEDLRVDLPGDRRMLSHVAVPEGASAVLDVLRARLPQGVSRDRILAATDPVAGDTIGTWASRILLRLLGREGLVVVEPATMRRFARGVVDHEIERPGELARSIRRAEDDAVARDEPRVLELARDELFFLVDDSGRRLRVEHANGAWHVEDGRALSSSQIRGLPESSFSWNVATRVLAQDAALPVVAQICGPTEIRYCGRLAAAHAILGLTSPALLARSSIVFVPARIERLCRELDVDPARLAAEGAAALPEASAVAEPPAVAHARQAIAALSPRGSAAVQRRHAALLHGIEAYAEALRRDDAERDDVASARRERVLAILHPAGEHQDRRFSPLPWLAQLPSDALARTSLDPANVGATRMFHLTGVRGNLERS